MKIIIINVNVKMASMNNINGIISKMRMKINNINNGENNNNENNRKQSASIMK
jgi:hypothetical protein